jgi:hypothetical protein
MRYVIVYLQDNPNGVVIQLDKRVTDVPKRFDCPGDKVSDQKELPKELFKILGVCSVHVLTYEVFIRNGEIFTWAEVLPAVMDTINKVLNGNCELTRARDAFIKDQGAKFPISPEVHINF